jgi:hypothetical protein
MTLGQSILVTIVLVVGFAAAVVGVTAYVMLRPPAAKPPRHRTAATIQREPPRAGNVRQAPRSRTVGPRPNPSARGGAGIAGQRGRPAV